MNRNQYLPIWFGEKKKLLKKIFFPNKFVEPFRQNWLQIRTLNQKVNIYKSSLSIFLWTMEFWGKKKKRQFETELYFFSPPTHPDNSNSMYKDLEVVIVKIGTL